MGASFFALAENNFFSGLMKGREQYINDTNESKKGKCK